MFPGFYVLCFTRPRYQDHWYSGYIILITKLCDVKQEMLLINRFFEAGFFHLQNMQMAFCTVKDIFLL